MGQLKHRPYHVVSYNQVLRIPNWVCEVRLFIFLLLFLCSVYPLKWFEAVPHQCSQSFLSLTGCLVLCKTLDAKTIEAGFVHFLPCVLCCLLVLLLLLLLLLFLFLFFFLLAAIICVVAFSQSQVSCWLGCRGTDRKNCPFRTDNTIHPYFQSLDSDYR